MICYMSTARAYSVVLHNPLSLRMRLRLHTAGMTKVGSRRSVTDVAASLVTILESPWRLHICTYDDLTFYDFPGYVLDSITDVL